MNQKEIDKRGMREAFNASRHSTCVRMSVGAAIRENYAYGDVLGTGWNGVPEGCVQCASRGCKRIQDCTPSGTLAETCRGLHAEQRALLDLLNVPGGIDRSDLLLYCTHHPCSICAKLIIGAGIKEVVFQLDYPDALAKELFAEAGITVRQYEGG